MVLVATCSRRCTSGDRGHDVCLGSATAVGVQLALLDATGATEKNSNWKSLWQGEMFVDLLNQSSCNPFSFYFQQFLSNVKPYIQFL